MKIHPDLADLSFLLGEWRGSGVGDYPTIEGFEYDETVTFSHVGKPFIVYGQRTRDRTTGEPLHTEAGYFRPAGEGAVELVLAQPSGIVEVHTGSIDAGAAGGGRIDLNSNLVGLAPTAKEVATVARKIEIDGDHMRYELWMGAVGQPHQVHLRAELSRQLN